VELAKTRDQLPPNQIGKYGQLQEWMDDVDAPDNSHRHMSPLWALYPGADITPADPNLFAAAKLLLKWRCTSSASLTGWSYAWRVPLWARVGDGENAWQFLAGLFQRKTLPNLFDLCGPFQIDGNFGATAGIAEMLLQSHQVAGGGEKGGARILDLLPALPKTWPNGSVTGLCARGGFVIDLSWKDGVLTHAELHSKLGNPCIVRSGKQEVQLPTKPGQNYAFDGRLKLLN
jgi:alpha-L-fucosidase 2